MQTQHLGHGQLTLGGAPIITFTTWDEGLRGAHKIVNMIGMRGIATGPDAVTINVSNGVPVAGEQFDYRSLVKSGAILDMSVFETGGTTATYRGVLTSYDRSDGVDAEPTSRFTFEGTKLESP
jgi:hypothetical protein